MSTRAAATLLIGLLAVAAAIFLWPAPKPPLVVGQLPPFCRDLSFESVVHAVCELDPKAYAVFVARADAAGKPYGSIQAFDKAMADSGTPVLLAMNGGMYHEGLGPVGLFVEHGRQETPLNRADGEGNFFLKPNGVFFVRPDGSAGVLETGAYAAAHPDVAYATQSGPMLVIDGQIHPRFEPDGASRYIRNGVGVRADGTVVLAISRQSVSLGSFAGCSATTVLSERAVPRRRDLHAVGRRTHSYRRQGPGRADPGGARKELRPSPLVGEGGSARSTETDEGCWKT